MKSVENNWLIQMHLLKNAIMILKKYRPSDLKQIETFNKLVDKREDNNRIN